MSKLPFRRFALGTRVHVRLCCDSSRQKLLSPGRNVTGTVVRLLVRDDSAWIQLDARSTRDVHPFPHGDTRATHVLAFPEHCDAVLAAAVLR